MHACLLLGAVLALFFVNAVCHPFTFISLRRAELLHTSATPREMSASMMARAAPRHPLRRIPTFCSTARAKHAGRVTSELLKASRHMQHFREKVDRGSKCATCWLPPTACMCESLKEQQVSAASVDVVVAMHYKEYGKMANTAKLVREILPDSQLLVHPTESGSVSNAIARTTSHTVLLWPGESSIPARDYRASAEQPGHITMLALDGTWRQVKSMARQYSGLPRVHITDELLAQGAARPHLRSEVREHGACTAEAIAIALKALGEPQCSTPILNAIEELNAAAARGDLGARSRMKYQTLHSQQSDPGRRPE